MKEPKLSETWGSTGQMIGPLARSAKSVKRHFLESELKTADDLIVEYMEYGTGDMDHSLSRQKLIWLLERLQEEVL